MRPVGRTAWLKPVQFPLYCRGYRVRRRGALEEYRADGRRLVGRNEKAADQELPAALHEPEGDPARGGAGIGRDRVAAHDGHGARTGAHAQPAEAINGWARDLRELAPVVGDRRGPALR